MGYPYVGTPCRYGYLDDHIDYLFDFFKGNVISYDDPTVGSTGRRNDGKKQIEVVAWFDVTTDEEDYVFFLHLFSMDTFDADNVGLYALRVVKAEEREREMTAWQDMAIPGVYRPHK